MGCQPRELQGPDLLGPSPLSCASNASTESLHFLILNYSTFGSACVAFYHESLKVDCYIRKIQKRCSLGAEAFPRLAPGHFFRKGRERLLPLHDVRLITRAKAEGRTPTSLYDFTLKDGRNAVNSRSHGS